MKRNHFWRLISPMRFLTSKTTDNIDRKSLLAILRKKTGYTFANCKKALELNNNDVTQAEAWLNQQASSLGWTKAAQLHNRPTSQGLIAIAIENNTGAMLELNCETDFVARNQLFRELAEMAVKGCLAFAQKQPTKGIGGCLQLQLNTEQLQQLPIMTSSSASSAVLLGDRLALAIGRLGENASLRRAVCFHGGRDDVLMTGGKVGVAAHVHPSNNISNNNGGNNDGIGVSMGKFGAMIAYKTTNIDDANTQILARQLCQHIVGMRPTRIGQLGIDSPNQSADDEECLIHQEFLLDPSVRISDLLQNTESHDENNSSVMEILDFKRYECGEELIAMDEKEELLRNV